ncbi:hypothetical protein N9V49_01550 [Flavobacteriaceae bacterium]|nr:hypothetical protein [Flavobacteriaceae bacterium]MDC6462099.1 hypothetical protein [Flavobacteriaceae bacterium]|tara:strand:+ start:97 stop:378 length:282 start_codon:yes stop_codon:yes gene_type:complete
MKTIYTSILVLIIASCNTKQAEISKWTEEDKDLTYKECITYAMDIRGMDVNESDDYCQCTLDILVTNFENDDDARIKIGEDKSLRLLFEGCDN